MKPVNKSKTTLLFLGVLVLVSVNAGFRTSLPGEEPAPSDQVFDILLKGGHVIDPASGINRPLDVGVLGNQVVGLGEDLPARQARTVINVQGYYVTPGLIDIHTYVDDQDVLVGLQGAPESVNPDHNALRNGVTTVVDAGSTGWRNFEAFRKNVVERARTRVLAFINILETGMHPSEIQTPELQQTVMTAQLHDDLVVGIRVSSSPSGNVDFFEQALVAAEATGKKLLVDFNSQGYDPAILSRLRNGDIVTGIYGEKGSLFEQSGIARQALNEARNRGVLFDVGHGSQGFWFRVAVPAVRAGFLADTISTGMDKEGLLLPRTEMMATVSKFLNMGLNLEDLIRKTTVEAARAIGHEHLGSLGVGSVADLAVLELQKGEFAFIDSGRARLTGNRSLRNALTIRNGEIVWDTDGLSTSSYETERTYSNYQ